MPRPQPTSTRPWPVPGIPFVMHQTWQHLLFAHWPLPPEEVEPLLPAGLALDTRDGVAWLGIVPFLMSGVRARGLPALPGTATFPELNVRTYVQMRDRGRTKPGVWFFSLDAANKLAVRVARTVFHLPYFDAEMTCAVGSEQEIIYRSWRTHRGAPGACLDVRYAPTGPAHLAEPGGLDSWLTERYALYAADPRGRLYIGEIDHPLWPLQPSTADFHLEALASASGLTLPDIPPRLAFARRLDVRIWPLRRVRP